jgi:hypothetical protein
VTPAAVTETDLEMVARAGDWLVLVDVAGATEEERALAHVCARAEAELREREWSAFEQLVPYITDGRVVPPSTDPERLHVLAAAVELGWHHQVPIGRAEEAGIA